MLEKQMLAADYGASGGRVMLGRFDGEKISLGEVHRFANEPVILNGKDRSTMYWDFLRLFHELKTGITRAGIMQGRSGRISAASAWTPGVWITDCLAETACFCQARSTTGIPEQREC